MAKGPTSSAGIRRYRMSVRARLALTYSALLTCAGIVMMTLVYVIMRFVPTYGFDSAASQPAVDAETIPKSSSGLLETTGPLLGTSAAAPVEPASELLINSPEQLFNVLLWTSAGVLVLLAIVGIAAGWIVAGRILKPLQYINSAVRRAAGGDLGHRIALVGPKDEISELAVNFDDMLSQLDGSFTASQRFAQNASHELRTPLATTRAMLDVAIAQNTTPELQKTFDRLRIMNERSIDTVTALLDLARVDSVAARLQEVDLAAIAREVLAGCADEAAQREIACQADLAPALTVGDLTLLRQLTTNLLHNAIRHNNDGGHLTLATGSAGGRATLEVSNSGPVLDPSIMTELTEPFSRTARRPSGSAAKGHGLGLSIVSVITQRHHGQMQLEPRAEGGLSVTVSLFSAPAPPKQPMS